MKPMPHLLFDAERITETPVAFLNATGEVFAVFDRQDSGNVSYGVRIGDEERFFVKSAGDPGDTRPYLSHAERVELLQNAARLARSCGHPALPRLYHVIEGSPWGPLLVYEWADGDLLGADRATRDDPRSAFQRFRALPQAEITAALDVIFDLHDALARAGWVASDFYDGCLLYDFTRRRLRVMDLDTYHAGPFVNTMGRMFGSTRFMAPEEFTRGSGIDQRTTVFTLGRTLSVFLGDGTVERAPFGGTDAQYAVLRRACREDPAERFASVADFRAAWKWARGGVPAEAGTRC